MHALHTHANTHARMHVRMHTHTHAHAHTHTHTHTHAHTHIRAYMNHLSLPHTSLNLTPLPLNLTLPPSISLPPQPHSPSHPHSPAPSQILEVISTEGGGIILGQWSTASLRRVWSENGEHQTDRVSGDCTYTDSMKIGF